MKEIFYKVGGTTIHLFKNEDGETPLLLLPSAGGRARDFNEIFPFLEREIPLVSLDYPGFGASDSDPSIQKIEDLTSFIVQFIETLPFRPVHMLGYSMGGWIALQTALSHPTLIQKLILVATSSHPIEKLPIRNIGNLNYKEILELLFFDPEIKKRKTLTKLTRKEKEELHRSSKAFKRFLEFKDSQPDLTQNLGTIRHPTLILAPEHDRLIPSPFQFDLGKAIPKSHLVYLKDTGHALVQEKPKEVSELISTFLKS